MHFFSAYYTNEGGGVTDGGESTRRGGAWGVMGVLGGDGFLTSFIAHAKSKILESFIRPTEIIIGSTLSCLCIFLSDYCTNERRGVTDGGESTKMAPGGG